MADVTAAEVMCAAIARRIRSKGTVFQGFASPLPTVAIRLARERWPDAGITHLSASGAVNGRPAAMPTSTEDAHLLEGASAHFTSPETFDLAARGDVDVMFVGSAQIDRRARMNGTLVGDPEDPTVRFGGGGGSGSLLPLVDEAFAWRTEHSPRTLPESVDFVTASGNLTYLLTPLCEFERVDGELRVVALLPGVSPDEVRERTGWDVAFESTARIDPPGEEELRILDEVDPRKVRRSGFDGTQLAPVVSEAGTETEASHGR